MYEKDTSSNATRPRAGATATSAYTSGICSSASSSSKTRSAEAMPDWNTLNIDAVWAIGIWSWREYWMNAWTSPMDIWPLATRRPPPTATMMKLRLPISIISGCMVPEKN